jgi:response regulator RpfG family c-di-GMP phosphodiesterase
MMQIKRRRLLVCLLIVSQLGCLTFGVVWAAKWLHGVFDSFIERNVAAQGRLLAYELERQFGEESITTVEPGTLGWDRLQQLCEKVDVPNDGFAFIMRRDTGALACHSKLKEDPSLLRSFPGRLPLLTNEGVEPLIEAADKAAKSAQPAATGELELAGKLYAVTCVNLPKLNAVLAISQSQASIALMSEELVNPLLQAGMVLVGSVVCATGVITVFLVRRFETTLMAVNASLEQEVELRTDSLVRTRNAVVFGLAKLSESRDKDTAGHLERIRSYVTILSSEMAKTNSEIDHHYVGNLAVASALHDVGKVGLPDAVLLKSGKLTPAERKAMQMHTELGGECLAAIGRQLGEDDFLELGRQVAMAHHEQWDGSGYPQGLRGREIPLAARIMAVADVYDALTSHRPYRPALSHAEAREWIVTHYGTQFDPEVVEAFVSREHDFVRLSAGSGATRQIMEESPSSADQAELDGQSAQRIAAAPSA